MTTTYAKSTLYRSEFMEKVLDEVSGQFEMDPLSPRIHSMINSLSAWSPHTYSAGERLTTIAYQYHGTTSTWWIILMFNGLASMNELQPGMRLKIPMMADIESAIKTANTTFVAPHTITI